MRASPAALARETVFTEDQWQLALAVLDDRADVLLPAVKQVAVQLKISPYLAAREVLDAIQDWKP